MQKSEVVKQLLNRGIKDPMVLAVFEEIKRDLFVPPSLKAFADSDSPLPIGEGQTISQPYIVALMTEEAHIKPGDRVLEIGTGSGFQAAVLSKLGAHVYTVERIPSLSKQAKKVLDQEGFSHIHFKVDDGSIGWKENAPYDSILVTAASNQIPPSLLNQLKPNGRLIIPVGDNYSQSLLRVINIEGKNPLVEEITQVRFVPLIGEEGFDERS